jgi:hypothetical protein
MRHLLTALKAEKKTHTKFYKKYGDTPRPAMATYKVDEIAKELKDVSKEDMRSLKAMKFKDTALNKVIQNITVAKPKPTKAYRGRERY